MENTILQKVERTVARARQGRLKLPENVIFKSGSLTSVRTVATQFALGGNAILITGGRYADESGLSDRIHTLLGQERIEMIRAPGIPQEPTVEMINHLAVLARKTKPALIISAGGGSVIDSGKAVAALATNDGPVEDYLEGLAKNLPVNQAPLPHIAIPTVAGTGAEMTKNAVIGCRQKGFKKSMRSDNMIPNIALIDPELSHTVPARVTAAGGLDALTQLIEPCITSKRTPLTTELACEALHNVQLGLSVAYEDPDNIPARERMAYVSMTSGLCLANSGLAMAHGIAAALGALHGVPHGLACGILLPHTLRYNRSACENELKQALAAFLNQTHPTNDTIEDGITAIESLGRWLQIPPDLKYLRLTASELEILAAHSMGSSMSANPIPLTPERTLEFLKKIA